MQSPLGALESEGYCVRSGLFSGPEIANMTSELSDTGRARGRAGLRHALQHPGIAGLAHDARLLGIAREVLGRTAMPFRATLFDKSPTSNWLVVWHQDTALPLRSRVDAEGWGPWSRKAGVLYAHAPTSALERILALRVHLDDSASENGPLRVLPGTHRLGVLTDEEVQNLARVTLAADCTVARGGVLAMRPLLIHSSSKLRSHAPRRVIHVEYASSMCTGDGLELAVA